MTNKSFLSLFPEFNIEPTLTPSEEALVNAFNGTFKAKGYNHTCATRNGFFLGKITLTSGIVIHVHSDCFGDVVKVTNAIGETCECYDLPTPEEAIAKALNIAERLA